MTEPGAAPAAAHLAAAHIVLHRCPRCAGFLKAQPGALACSACGGSFPHQDGIVRFRTVDAASPGFDAGYFEILEEVENEHFWFVSRRQVILDSLRRHVPDLAARPLYDIGCGPGGLLAFLAANGVPVAGACDSFHEALVLARRKLDAPLAHVGGDMPPPLAPGRPMIGMFDVLEHIDDDEATLRWAAGVLEPGGILVVTVPGHPFLFDEADVLAFHRRRYRRRELGEKMRRAGFEIRQLTHFMSPLVPMLVAARTVGRLLRRGGRTMADQRRAELAVTPGLNSVLRGVLAVERRALRVARPPFGTSLLAVAARTGSAPL